MFLKNTLVLVAIIVLVSGLAARCTPAAPGPAAERINETVVGVREVPAETVARVETVEAAKKVRPAEPDADRVRLDMIVSAEPPTMDPALAIDGVSIFFVRQMFVGLTSFDEQAQVIPALATGWSVSADGLTWTYHLRDDIHWTHRDPTSGEFRDLGPVTAGDVVYGVQRTLDPNTASSYAYVLYIIQGAEAFNTADPAAENLAALRSAVGVRAVDDTTVEFTLTAPAAYFPSISGLWVTFPQHQAAIEQHKHNWTEAGLIVTNGPYTLREWRHDAAVMLEKNPLWINAEEVQIELAGGPIIQEASTAMAMYERGDIDMMGDPPGWNPPLADMDRLKTDPTLSRELLIAPQLCTYYFGFVHTRPPFDDARVRKAFGLAINRTDIVQNVTKGEELPARSFTSPGNFGSAAADPDIGSSLVQANYSDQVTEAQALLAEAGYPDGAGLDVLVMHDTSAAHAQIIQAVQAMWQEAFPQAKIRVENQEWGVYLDTLLPEAPDAEKPDIYRLGWCADYPDANNWLNEVFHSKSGQNFARYNNPEFDRLVEQAASETNPAKREDLYRQAEEIFINQDMAINPIFYHSYVRLYKPWLTKVVISPVSGDPIAEWKIDWAAKKAARGN